jgi:hypothetical protein
MGPGRSATRLIYVVPKVFLSTLRENSGYSPWLDASFTAVVHRVRGRYPSPLVFFYVKGPGSSQYSRVAMTPFHFDSRQYQNALLKATARIYSPGQVSIIACFRHRLMPDMGPPFTLGACGLPSVR